MKKGLFAFTLFTLLFTLVACSKTTSSTNTTKGTAPLSAEAELLVGTFKLEGTDQAVTADQARQLLPLWQTLQSLANSNTAATEEMNALVDQIKSTMTTQQMAKITAIKLTQQDVMTVMSQTGFSPNGASTTATPLALNGLPGSGNSQGGAGGGGMPAGGGGGPSGGGPSGGGAPPSGGFQGGGDPGIMGGQPGQSTTPQAVRSNGFANQVPAPLLNALIQMLQKKTQ